jgi:hypothetical protein
MDKKFLEFLHEALACAETAAEITSIVVPAIRKVESILGSNDDINTIGHDGK